MDLVVLLSLVLSADGISPLAKQQVSLRRHHVSHYQKGEKYEVENDTVPTWIQCLLEGKLRVLIGFFSRATTDSSVRSHGLTRRREHRINSMT